MRWSCSGGVAAWHGLASSSTSLLDKVQSPPPHPPWFQKKRVQAPLVGASSVTLTSPGFGSLSSTPASPRPSRKKNRSEPSIASIKLVSHVCEGARGGGGRGEAGRGPGVGGGRGAAAHARVARGTGAVHPHASPGLPQYRCCCPLTPTGARSAARSHGQPPATGA